MNICEDSEDEIKSTLLSQRFVIHARKKYRCADCGRAIEIGESCVVTNKLVDGEFYSDRTHTMSGHCLDFEW